jgi:hypothetical protein
MLQCRDHAISPTPSSAWQTQLPTQRDPTTKQFILGKATDPSAGKAEEEPANTDEWGTRSRRDNLRKRIIRDQLRNWQSKATPGI